MRKKKLLITFMMFASMSVFTACLKNVNSNATDGNETVSQSETTSKTDVVNQTEETTTEKVEVVKDQPIVYFSEESGFYDKEFELSMECPVEGAVIYYTLDGSIPTQSSTKYEAPIKLKNKSNSANTVANHKGISVGNEYVPDKVNKGNIVRAVAVFTDGTTSPVTNGTFFVGLDREALYGECPVISLITEKSNLFDYEKGIYVLGKTYDDWIAEDPANAEKPSYRARGNFANKGRDWERPVYFEYIGTDGKVKVAADMGIRIKGASTRTYYQKSFKLFARKDYGTSKIKYPLIPGNMKSDGSGAVEEYKTFVLRNGGNDTDVAKLRDPYLQQLASNRSFETQQYMPCAVYIDGEYWGSYTIVEDYSDDYFEDNYGVKKDDVVVVKCGKIEEGTEEDLVLFTDMYDFIISNDMSDDKNYAKVGEMLDIQGFIDYCAFQNYIYNHDSIAENNNWSLWRTRKGNNATPVSDAKWRFLLFDTEFSTGVYNGASEFETNNLRDFMAKKGTDYAVADANGEYKTMYMLDMFFALLENDQFMHDFIVTLCDIRNYDFERTYASKVLKEITKNYATLAPESYFRNGPDWVVMWNDPADYYAGKIKELTQFMYSRYGIFPKFIKDTFDLSEPVSVDIKIDDAAMGTVQINSTLLDFERLGNSGFTGKYFKEYYITVKAVEFDGYRFAGWEVTDGEISDAKAMEATVTLTGDCKIKAVFEKK